MIDLLILAYFMLMFLKKIKFIHVFWFFFYFFLFSLALRGSFSYLDPDLGWHLKVGQEIAQNRAVPHLNHYNYTFSGDWVDHEWLSNFFVYQIYTHWGYLALTIIFAALVIAVLILLNVLVYRAYPKKPAFFLVAFLQAFGLIAALPHFGVRIQELALLFLLFIILIIRAYSLSKNWRWLLLFLPLFYFWACLHASFLIGFFVVFSYLGIKGLEKILSRFSFFSFLDFSDSWAKREFLVFGFFGLTAASLTLITPYKLELYSFLFGYRNTVYLSYIREWLSQFSYPFNYWQLLYLSLVAVALFVYAYDVYQKRRKLNLWQIFLPLVFFILSFKSRRHLPLLFVVSFLFLVEIFCDYLDLSARKISAWVKFYFLFSLILVLIMQIIQIRPIQDPFTFFDQDYPRSALDFLKNKPEYRQLRIFNDYAWGGYLIWVAPDIKPFIDGRLPQVFYKDRTFLEEYLEFFKKNGPRVSKFQEYDIRLVLIKSEDRPLKAKKWEKFLFGIKDKELDSPNYLKEYLDKDFSWRLVYYDPTALIYLKVN